MFTVLVKMLFFYKASSTPLSIQKLTNYPSPGCLLCRSSRGCSLGGVLVMIKFISSTCIRHRMMFTKHWFVSLFFLFLYMSTMFGRMELVMPLRLVVYFFLHVAIEVGSCLWYHCSGH